LWIDIKEEITAPASSWLRTAAAGGHVEEIRETLVVSPDADSLLQARGEDGQSLLVYAVANGHAKAVEYLLKEGCDVNSVDGNARTPLMEASLWSHAKIVDILIKAGADKSMTDWIGMTAADLADESERNDEEAQAAYQVFRGPICQETTHQDSSEACSSTKSQQHLHRLSLSMISPMRTSTSLSMPVQSRS
jgi:hypothetical protein